FIVYDDSNSSSFSLATNDFDGNGSLDIVVGNSPGSTKLYINISNGKEWKERILSKNKFRTYDIIDSDINNDGKIDILEANTDEHNFYFINK
ncbi:VCBS repeat-containing protein, partial [Flavobacteriaceae bacterium]|nr:VCBS repeat-containing protein [Flavobacteriaceae bacterium]